jgi:hypothetical protein
MHCREMISFVLSSLILQIVLFQGPKIEELDDDDLDDLPDLVGEEEAIQVVIFLVICWNREMEP